MENNLVSKSKLMIYIKARQDNPINRGFLKRLDPLNKLKEELENGTFDLKSISKEELVGK